MNQLMTDTKKAEAQSKVGAFLTARQMALKPHSLSRDGDTAVARDGGTWKWSTHFNVWACVESRIAKLFTIPPVKAAPPSESGALASNGATCSCGTDIRTSLGAQQAEMMVLDHAAWHAKRGDLVERSAS